MATDSIGGIYGNSGVVTMKITILGLIVAAKNLGLFLTSYTAAGIRADPQQFCLALTIYALISVPSDLYMLNHVSKKKE